MPSFKFGRTEVASKDFYKQRQITNIFKINVNTVLLFDKGPCNNGKGWRYSLGYHVDGETNILLFLKTPKTYLAMVYHNKARTPTTQCHLMLRIYRSGCFSIEIFGMMLIRSCLKN